MTDHSDIRIIYKDHAPELLADSLSERMIGNLKCLDENALLSGQLPPEGNCLVVFFSVDGETPEIRRYLANAFPGAELVGYRAARSSDDDFLRKAEDGLVEIRLPAPYSLIRFLFDSLAAAKRYRRELVRAQTRTEDIRDFFDAFVKAIQSTSDMPDRKMGLQLLVDKILSHIRAEECLVYLFGESGTPLRRVYSTGNIHNIDLFEQRANGLIVERALAEGTPYRNNSYSFELKVPFSRQSAFIRSVLCYPLVHQGERIGAIELLNKVDGGFTTDDQSLLEMMLAPVAVTIRTVDAFEKSERLTITDDLTKLYNYRYLKKYLESDVKRCLRYKKKVSLLFIDVDGFKRINDTFGHLVGSQALAEMGQVFKQIVRETDVVGRYGGDEFVIVLPETPLNGAMAIAERIRKKVEGYEFVAQNLSIRLTVSLGVANCPKHTLTADGLIKKADAAMYRAKELSKNSIKVAV